MISFAASSTPMSSTISSRRGTNRRKPEVGFGVVGMNTGDHVLVCGGLHLAPRLGGDEADRPDTLARIFHQRGFLEILLALAEHRFDESA